MTELGDVRVPIPIIPENQRRSICIAADVRSLSELSAITAVAKEFVAVQAVKIGFSLALRGGLSDAAAAVKKVAPVTLIYDHQKAGTDIPAMGRPFAETCREAGIDGVIIFPHAGPRTLDAFVKAAFDSQLVPIVGLMMTHDAYLAADGGYVIDSAPWLICDKALDLGVTHFVLPATNPTLVKAFSNGPLSSGGYTLWMPGIGSQGGSLTAALSAAEPNRAVGIIGSAIYGAEDPKKALSTFASEIEL